jgi:hypothetical protein
MLKDSAEILRARCELDFHKGCPLEVELSSAVCLSWLEFQLQMVEKRTCDLSEEIECPFMLRRLHVCLAKIVQAHDGGLQGKVTFSFVHLDSSLYQTFEVPLLTDSSFDMYAVWKYMSTSDSKKEQDRFWLDSNGLEIIKKPTTDSNLSVLYPITTAIGSYLSFVQEYFFLRPDRLVLGGGTSSGELYVYLE